ncbi:MAG TPA: methyltransferase domain-containing protein, partial [Pseudonocardiaceae bacterium]|nr:methyltransferase domain-containing protein [Pseudonocardiaceae bacterium]
MTTPRCRFCRSSNGDIVLDLGRQPACDHFPLVADPVPDPVYPLRLWLCARCRLAQLAEDGTTPAEPRGIEPAALVAQARAAVQLVAEAGLLPPGASVAEYGSPHGGSWLDLLISRGLRTADEPQLADVVIDCFGLMHAPDQHAALAERAARLAPGGTLLLQFHSLASIVMGAQWNVVRHGHFAYYSTSALCRMLESFGLAASTAWRFDLYGGTVLLAARRAAQTDRAVRELAQAEVIGGV